MPAIKNKSLLIIFAVLAVLLLYGIISYNGFVSKEEKVITTYNNLQANYQRRFDLIPMLTQVVKASSEYEQKTLVQLAEIRAKAGSVTTMPPTEAGLKNLESGQSEFATSFNRVLAVLENYPEVKAQRNFLALQDQIKGTERRIRVARGDFNEAVRMYNTSLRTFPSSLMAKLFGFKTKDGFVAEENAKNIVEIKF